MIESEAKSLQEHVIEFENHLGPMDDEQLKVIFPEDEDKSDLLGEHTNV